MLIESIKHRPTAPPRSGRLSNIEPQEVKLNRTLQRLLEEQNVDGSNRLHEVM